MSETPDYYTSDPDWAAYAKRNGINYGGTKSTGEAPPPLNATIVGEGRANQVIEESKWAHEHPLSLVGYQSSIQHITVRDGHSIEIKVSWPLETETSPTSNEKKPLPLLFVFHGGGWIQGTHTTEEAWLLWPLMTHLKLVIVSVAYRLAPEHLFPTYINDCWDVFQTITDRHHPFTLAAGPFDHDRILLSGSSAGALIAATLAQKAKVEPSSSDSKIHGVILNVPVTCDYRHWPAHNKANKSYVECETALLSSTVMKQVWDIAVPEGAGADPQASPLLGVTSGLPPHLLYIAGQDPLRDEGIEYSRILTANNVSNKMHIYPGVPHTFGEMWELKATQKFWVDIVGDVRTLL